MSAASSSLYLLFFGFSIAYFHHCVANFCFPNGLLRSMLDAIVLEACYRLPFTATAMLLLLVSVASS